MFLIRQATHDDVPTLLKLAKMVHFINLPADPEILRQKIARSRRSFAGESPSEREREFVFVLEDTETGNVLGTSSIVSCLSWPGRPHTFLTVRKREHFSRDLQTGQVHLTLQLGTDETGPSEIGGLVLGPSYRGHPQKLGMSLSLVRFHFVGRCREWFADRIIAEMMGPLNADSTSEFWNAFGRRFINLSFAEADLFCQRSKEFITSLIPSTEIYVSLLSPEARNNIGKVGAETEPAKRLLESVGFAEMGHIDPFDGGPYLEALTDEIDLVRRTCRGTLAAPGRVEGVEEGFVSVHDGPSFKAMRTVLAASGGTVTVPHEVAEILGASAGDEVAWTALRAAAPSPSRARGGSSRGERRPRSRAPAT
jgi:arginine N-succinyltransferase